MKIIDETGAVVENPDLTLGYLTDDTQPLEHPAQEEWVEKVPIQRYIRYTAEELAAQEEERKKQEAKDKLPETVAALQAALADADALNVEQAYRLTLLELNVSDTDDTDNADNT